MKKNFFFNAQISHAAPSSWNQILRNCTENMNNLLIQGHHLMKKHKMHSLSKLNSATWCKILIGANKLKLTLRIYFENLFSSFTPEWKIIYLFIYLLHRRVTNLRTFHYKLLNNVLCPNSMLFLRLWKIPLSGFPSLLIL